MEAHDTAFRSRPSRVLVAALSAAIALITGCSASAGNPPEILGPTVTVTAPMDYPSVSAPSYIDVGRYGATGDFRSDDTAAIQAALDAVPRNGGVVFFPVGGYTVSSGLVATNTTTILGIRGLDGTGSRIEAAGDVPVTLTLKGDASVLDSIEVTNAAGTAMLETVGVQLNGWFSQVRNSRLSGFGRNLVLTAGFYSVLDSSFREFGYVGIDIDIPAGRGDAGDGTISGSTFDRHKIKEPGAAGVLWRSGGGMRLANNKINGEGTLLAGVTLRPRTGVETGVFILTGNSIENFRQAGIVVDDPFSGITNGMTITNNQIAGRVTREALGIDIRSGMAGLVITGNSIMFTAKGISLADVRSGTVAGNVLSDIYGTGIAINTNDGNVKVSEQTIDSDGPEISGQ